MKKRKGDKGKKLRKMIKIGIERIQEGEEVKIN